MCRGGERELTAWSGNLLSLPTLWALYDSVFDLQNQPVSSGYFRPHPHNAASRTGSPYMWSVKKQIRDSQQSGLQGW